MKKELKKNKYIPIEKQSEAEIRAEIDQEYELWNHIALHGCADPGWPDGVNMNLVRNHIIFKQRILQERGDVQMNLFGDILNERPLPPKVPPDYMVKDGDYPHRLDKQLARFPALVWGKGGEYRA